MNNPLRRCLKDRSAGIALTFAVTAIPIVGVIGVGIDLGLATQAKTQLNLASDAAALAAAKGAADAFTAGQSDYISAGQTAGKEWFKSQAGTVLGTALQDPTVTVTQSGAVFTSQVSYQGTVAPYFAPIFGVTNIALGGSSGATIATNAYVSVTFLLDNSSSMLVAATQDDVKKLGNLTQPFYKSKPVNPAALAGLPCAFACHWDSNNNDYYGLALSNGIQLRFDVLKTAVSSAITQMTNQKIIDNQFSVSIYTFNTNLKQIFSESTSLADGAAAAQSIQSPAVDDFANTDFPTSMNKLAQASTPAGDGSTTGSRKKALIIVTDGMVDIEPWRHVPDTKGPVNPADCATMKKLGYNVYVLYTTFVTSPLDYVLVFNHDLLPYLTGFDDQGKAVNVAGKAMVPSLQACASAPANFAQASDPDAIKAAVSKLLQSAISNGGRYTR